MTTNAKVYHSYQENICFHVMRGTAQCSTEQFVNHRLETEDAEVIAFLDAIADKPGSPVYTQEPVIDPAQEAAKQEVISRAQAAHDKVVKTGDATK